MRILNYLSILFVISGLLLFGCSEESNPVTSQSMEQNGDNNLAKATVSKMNVTFPGNPNPVFIPCANGGAGEDVISSGTIHGVLTIVQDGNRGSHMQFNFHSQGITAVGQTTGDTYQAPGGERGANYERFTGFPHIQNLVVIIKYIGPGPNNNFSRQIKGHVTVNANGEMSVGNFSDTVDCK